MSAWLLDIMNICNGNTPKGYISMAHISNAYLYMWVSN